MEYSDMNQYRHRVTVVGEINAQHPELVAAMPDDERATIEDYFIAGAQADSLEAFRSDKLQSNPTYELHANRAYESLMAAAGRSEMSEPNYRDDPM